MAPTGISIKYEKHRTTYCIPYVYISDGTPSKVIADRYDAKSETKIGNQDIFLPAIRYSFVDFCFPPNAKYIPMIVDTSNMQPNTT